MKTKLKLVINKDYGQDIAKVRRSNPKYKEYVKYRSKIEPGQDIFSFQEWLKDDHIFHNHRYN